MVKEIQFNLFTVITVFVVLGNFATMLGANPPPIMAKLHLTYAYDDTPKIHCVVQESGKPIGKTESTAEPDEGYISWNTSIEVPYDFLKPDMLIFTIFNENGQEIAKFESELGKILSEERIQLRSFAEYYHDAQILNIQSHIPTKLHLNFELMNTTHGHLLNQPHLVIKNNNAELASLKTTSMEIKPSENVVLKYTIDSLETFLQNVSEESTLAFQFLQSIKTKTGSELFGEFEISVEKLASIELGRTEPFSTPLMKQNSQIATLTLNIHYDWTLLHALRENLKFNYGVAIDFSDKAGHSLDSKVTNQFVHLINILGKHLEQYSMIQQLPAIAFNARRGKSTNSPTTFPLDLDEYFCPTVDEIVKGYYKFISEDLDESYVPTVSSFAKVIAKMVEITRSYQTSRPYTVFIVLAQKDIIDLSNSTREIIAACRLPISIIIIGMGGSSEKFPNLQSLATPAVGAVRKTVHFVALPNLNELTQGQDQVILETLAQVPEQVTEWQAKYGKK